jgi:hypothetical protein
MSKPKIIVSLIILTVFAKAISVVSYPRLAAEQNAPCATCHVNPTGGGMRNEFGNYSVAFNELCLPQTKHLVRDKYKSPRLSESVTIGFDSRHLVFEDGNIFRMQTDAYLAVEPYHDLVYQLRFWENGISESYALLFLDNKNSHIKVGRFQPTFGLRVADHTSFIRNRTGNGSNVYLDGLSIGSSIGGFNITTEFYNPNDHGMLVLHAYRPFAMSDISGIYGCSYRISEYINGSTGLFPDNRSLFGGISYNRFTLLGEIDISGRSNDSLTFYSGLTTRLEYGLYFLTEYNFFDNNRDIADGVDEYLRFSLELYPLPFIELRPSYTFLTRGYSGDRDEFFLQIHFGY